VRHFCSRAALRWWQYSVLCAVLALGSLRAEPAKSEPVIVALYGGITLNSYHPQSEDAVLAYLDKCAEYGVDQLSVNFYDVGAWSDLLEKNDARTDELLMFAFKEAHRRGIKIYASIPTFGRSERDEKFVREHGDEIFAHFRDGTPDTHMLSPASPEVREYKTALIKSLLERYPLDGIMLDFIRWGNYAGDDQYAVCLSGYDEAMLERAGIQKCEIPEPSDERMLKARASFVTDFIRNLKAELETMRPGLPIGVFNSSAAGRLPSYCYVGQDWAGWEKEELVEEHHPMFLMDSIPRQLRAIQTLADVRNSKSKIFASAFLAEGFDLNRPERPTRESILDLTRRAVAMGCEGVHVVRNFELETFGLWEVIREIKGLDVASIRRETQQPAVINLLASEGVDSWLFVQGIADRRTAGALAIDPAKEPAGVVEMEQTVSGFPNTPVHATRSLGFEMTYRNTALGKKPQIEVRIRLAYQKGEPEEIIISGDDATEGKQGMRKLIQSFPVNRKGILETATVSVSFRQGRVLVADTALYFDTLDSPLDSKDLVAHLKRIAERDD